MPLLLRAIISGFGYKIGAELGRLVAEKVGLRKPDGGRSEDANKDEEEELPAGLPKDPPGAEDPEPGEGDADRAPAPAGDDGSADQAA